MTLSTLRARDVTKRNNSSNGRRKRGNSIYFLHFLNFLSRNLSFSSILQTGPSIYLAEQSRQLEKLTMTMEVMTTTTELMMMMMTMTTMTMTMEVMTTELMMTTTNAREWRKPWSSKEWNQNKILALNFYLEILKIKFPLEEMSISRVNTQGSSSNNNNSLLRHPHQALFTILHTCL